MNQFNRLVDPNSLPPHAKSVDVLSPVSGKPVALNTLPDAIFSNKLFGEGTVIEASGHQVLAPFDGVVEYLPTSCHQIRLKSSHGIRLLIQLGLKSDSIHGEGFKARVVQGDRVKLGDALIDFDLAKLKTKLDCSLFVITMLNSDRTKGMTFNYHPMVACEDTLMTLLL